MGLCLGKERRCEEGRASHVALFLRGAHTKKPPLKGEVPAKRAEGFRPPRRKVAAALSAAVTTTKFIGDAPTSQAEPSKGKGATQTPTALRERGSGGEALLSEKRPLPQNFPPPVFPGGSAREGAFLQKGPLPRITLKTTPFSSCRGRSGDLGGGRGSRCPAPCSTRPR